MLGCPAGVPAERALAGDLRMDADRLTQMGALLVGREILVVDPFQAVAGDFPARLLHRGDRLGVALKRGRDAEDGDRQIALGEHAPQAPEAGAGAVFVDRLHAHVPLPRPGRRADDLGQEAFGSSVPVEDVVLAPLLVVDDELDADARSVRPARVGRIAAVADEIAGIAVSTILSCLDRWNSSRARRGAGHDSARPARPSRNGSARCREMADLQPAVPRAAEIIADVEHEFIDPRPKCIAAQKRRVGAPVGVGDRGDDAATSFRGRARRVLSQRPVRAYR